jgi:hypothetical protein
VTRQGASAVRRAHEDGRRLGKGRRSGFERGGCSDLYGLAELARTLRTKLSITIAQPEVSKSGISPSQLELLASTEVYLIRSRSDRTKIGGLSLRREAAAPDPIARPRARVWPTRRRMRLQARRRGARLAS